MNGIQAKTPNDESSAVQSPNIAAPLSENPTSNEAEGGNMNTTTQAPAATISEKELWTAFLKTQAEENYPDNVRDYWMSGFDTRLLDETMEAFIDDCETSDSAPSERLNLLISEMKGLLFNLREVQEGFAAYIAARKQDAAE